MQREPLNQNEPAIRNFKPFIVRTKNIAKELVSVATKFDVKASVFDFNLLTMQTFLGSEEQEVIAEEVLADEYDKLEDDSILASPNIRIFQVYEIEVILAKKESPFSQLQLSIGANSSMSRVLASIKPGSYIECFDGIKEELHEFINKRKLRANMLINIWDKNLESEIDKFLAKVQVAEKLTIKEKITLEVAKALEPVPTINDKIIFHYKKKKKEEKKYDKVDHVNRGFIQGVVEKDLLIEYIKPRKGLPGRNCRGEYIAPSEPTVKNKPTFEVNENIEVIETEQNIEYRAKIGGYVVFENNTYDINVEVEVSEINFKTTGSIEAGVDSEVKINVKETDVFKDAIGAGMEVEANEVNVNGNIGHNAKIKAVNVKVGGQTHQSSCVEADNVEIKIHKGKVKAQNVKIDRLEQGIVEADVVEITQATGGKIIAKEVVIDTILSHVHILASSKIEINNFKGEENTFTISPILYDSQKELLKENEEELIVQKRKVRSIEEEFLKHKNILDSNAEVYMNIKKRLISYKKSGVKMPGSFVAKFKEFQELQKRIEGLQKELLQNRSKLELISAKANSFQEDIINAKIINHDKYIGHNEIRFKLVEPEIELYHVPKGNQDEKCFMLELDENSGDYKIVSKEEV